MSDPELQTPGRGPRAASQYLAVLAMVLAFKAGTVLDPPMWDSAMGLFPAAYYLADTGFDAAALLGEPGYGLGGPNAHSTSVVTLITAALLLVAGSWAIPVLHLLHAAAAALALTWLHRLARPTLGVASAWALVAAAFLFPLVHVQTGRLYLELPLLLCALGMLHAYAKGRAAQATLWATVGFAVKETGIVLPVALALLRAAEPAPPGRRLGRAAIALLPSVLVLGIPTLLAAGQLTDGTQHYTLFPDPGDAVQRILRDVRRYLFRVPDVLLLLVVFVVTLPRRIPALLRGWTAREDWSARVGASRTETGVALLACGFVALYFVVLPFVFNFTLVLPRYYTFVVPFLLFWLALRLKEVADGRFVVPVLMVLSIWGITNRDGRFYPTDLDVPGPGNDFSLTERSMAYRSLDHAQQELMSTLESARGADVIWWGQLEHYLNAEPRLGYVSTPIPTGRPIHLTSDWPRVTRAAGCVLAVENYPFLGGPEVQSLLESVAPSASMQHDTALVVRNGPYAITVHRLRARGARCGLRGP